jgi:spore maturation protein CgeB
MLNLSEQPMRVLTVLEQHHPLLRALKAAGCETEHLGPTELPQSGGKPYFYIGDIFQQIKHPLQLLRIRRVLSEQQVPYVNWNRDAPWNCAIKPWRKLLVRVARPADIHLAHSLQSVDLFGEPVVYFPNAADTEQYNLGRRTLESLRDSTAYQFDVSFIGTLNPTFRMVRARLEFLTELVRRLKSTGLTSRLFDTSPGSALTVEKQVEIIQVSRINLSIGAVCDKPSVSWGLPERCFGIAACGGFLLCDQRRHIADTFPAQTWGECRDIEDCLEQIKFFTGQFDLSRNMAEKLHQDVMLRHTYTVRAHALLNLVKEWKRDHSTQPGNAEAR